MSAVYPKVLFIAGILFALLSCHHSHPPRHDISETKVSLQQHISEDLGDMLAFLSPDASASGDSIQVYRPSALQQLYAERSNQPLWSDSGSLRPQADSLLDFLHKAAYQGLNPSWYHAQQLDSLLQAWNTDSLARHDAVTWAKADLYLSDAFMRMLQDLHYGVLPADSLSLHKLRAYSDSVLLHRLTGSWKADTLKQALLAAAPGLEPYQRLLLANREYRDRIALRDWDTLPEHATDTLVFQQLLRRRLEAESYLKPGSDRSLKEALKAFQREHNLYPDAVVGKNTLAALNVPRSERFRQIALSLDRWRQFPDSMPPEYLLVNLAAFHLYLFQHDTLVLSSRVVVGKPSTPSPQLNSYIYNFQLYPYWRVPYSIATKEMLPRIQKDIGYLAKNNLEVLDRHNRIVNPAKVNWKRFSRRYFPYRIRQMIGLDNSLGILKFNFPNKYSVYLHDTNEHSLFDRNFRALSHGCIRVQQWDSLAHYLVRTDTLRHLPDSLNTWLLTETQKYVALDHRLPLYIRYMTTEANGRGRPVFYQDLYGYDARDARYLSARP